MSERESGILGNRAVRGRVFDRWGYKCCNCGTTENLRLDHIVAVKVGGNDIESNLCVLCVQCHYKKHLLDKTSEEMSRRIKEGKARSIKNDGRPRDVPENYKELLNDYVFCRIGRKELSKRWGIIVTSRKDPTKKIPVDMVHLTDKVWYKEYLKELGIKSVTNKVGVNTTKYLKTGEVGYIVYESGEKEIIYDQRLKRA